MSTAAVQIKQWMCLSWTSWSVLIITNYAIIQIIPDSIALTSRRQGAVRAALYRRVELISQCSNYRATLGQKDHSLKKRMSPTKNANFIPPTLLCLVDKASPRLVEAGGERWSESAVRLCWTQCFCSVSLKYEGPSPVTPDPWNHWCCCL